MKVMIAIIIVLVTTVIFLLGIMFYLKWYFTRKGKGRMPNGLPKTSLDFLQDFENSLWSDIVPILVFLIVSITVYLTIVLILR